MEEEKFKQKNISNLIRNILTLRYDASQESRLPILNSHDFLPSKKYDQNFIEIAFIFKSGNVLRIRPKTRVESTPPLRDIVRFFVDSSLV